MATEMSMTRVTEHQAAVLRFFREFKPDGWRLPLTKQHEGSHVVLGGMADAGLLTIDKQTEAWTYRV